jgi:hypothetical protein
MPPAASITLAIPKSRSFTRKTPCGSLTRNIRGLLGIPCSTHAGRGARRWGAARMPRNGDRNGAFGRDGRSLTLPSCTCWKGTPLEALHRDVWSAATRRPRGRRCARCSGCCRRSAARAPVEKASDHPVVGVELGLQDLMASVFRSGIALATNTSFIPGLRRARGRRADSDLLSTRPMKASWDDEEVRNRQMAWLAPASSRFSAGESHKRFARAHENHN